MGPVVVGVSELSQALIDAGNNLLKLHSSTDALLTLLDEFESLLSNVEQDLPVSVQDALIPSMKALISADLLRNPNSDVRVSVVSCLTEIMRITAPEAPYNDAQMKDIFQMTIEAFGKLADASCRSYRKAVVILDTVSKIRSCLVMLDLECDELILEMFRQFLKIISPDHPQPVLLSMETIMITVIDESEEISMDLLDILLINVKKESQDVSPMSSKLVEKVLSRCANKLKPCIMEALNSKRTSLDMYSSVVSLICQSESATTQAHNIVNNKETEADEKKGQVATSDQLKDNLDLGASGKGIPSKNRSKRSARDGTHRINGNEKIRNEIDLKQALKQGLSESTDAETDSGSTRKRGRKPNSLMNPEEGYDHSWVSGRKKSSKASSSKKMQEKELSDSSLGKPTAKKTPLPKESSTSPAKVGQTNQSVVISFPSSSRARTGSRKRSRVKMVETGHDRDSFSSPTSKKESIQVVKKEPPEEEHVMESNLEKTEDSSKTTKSGKKVRVQNGSAKTVTKKPLAETKMVKTSGKKSGQSGAEKKNTEGTSMETLVSVLKSSKRKKMASQAETTPLTKKSKQTPKSHPKKRTATKETESDVHALGEELVGKRVNVWWPLDEMFYAGVVDSYCSVKKMHRVSYSDGDSEELNLKKERWEIIEDKSTANEQDEEIDLPESVPLSDLIQRRKAKKRKSMPANEEPSESPEAKSSAKTLEKADSEANLTKKVKRTKGASKTVSNEPKTKEQKNVKPSEKSNAESGRTKARTGRNQKATRARSRKNRKDSDEKEESETKGEDSLKSQKEANSEPESKIKDQPPEDSNAEPKTGGEEQESSKEPTKSEEKRREDGKETDPNISETGKVVEVKEESDKAELGNSSVSADP